MKCLRLLILHSLKAISCTKIFTFGWGGLSCIYVPHLATPLTAVKCSQCTISNSFPIRLCSVQRYCRKHSVYSECRTDCFSRVLLQLLNQPEHSMQSRIDFHHCSSSTPEIVRNVVGSMLLNTTVSVCLPTVHW